MHQVADQGKQIMEGRATKLDEEIQILMDEKNSLSDEKKTTRMESEFNEKITTLTENNKMKFAQKDFHLNLNASYGSSRTV